MKEPIVIFFMIISIIFFGLFCYAFGKQYAPITDLPRPAYVPDLCITIIGDRERVEVAIGKGRLIPVTPVDVITTDSRTFLEERQKGEER